MYVTAFLLSALLAWAQLLSALSNQNEQCSFASNTSDKVWIIVVDSGSTGTRIKLYQFQFKNKTAKWIPLKSISRKLKGGLSQLNPDSMKDRFQIVGIILHLVKMSKEIIKGRNDIRNAPVFVYGTAGLRKLSATTASKLLKYVEKSVNKSPFDKEFEKSAMKRIQVISAEQEAQFGWLSINYLLSYDVYKQKSNDSVGFLDMGGGSTQIAFRLSDLSLIKTLGVNNSFLWYPSYRTLLAKKELSGPVVFTKSFSGFGFETSMMKMVDAYDDCESNVKCSPADTYDSVCFHPNLNTTLTFGTKKFWIKGKNIADGKRYEACINLIKAVIKKYGMEGSTQISKLLKNNQRDFFGVSGFYYYAVTIAFKGNVTSNPIELKSKRCNGFKLTLDLIKKAGRHFCTNPVANDKDRDWLFACMRSVYVIVLLRDVYQFNDDSVFHMCKSFTVSGDKSIDVGWPFGVSVQAVKILTKCY